MTAAVALFRAINIAGRATVAMADLRAMAAGIGLEGAATVLQTGNLVFDAGDASARELERALEDAASARLGLDTDVMVRTGDEWAQVIAANPFRQEAERAPSRLVVMALKDAPDPAGVEALRAAISGAEYVSAGGREFYAVYPDGIGRSKLTSALIERHLGTRATGRNWNTALKIAAALRRG